MQEQNRYDASIGPWSVFMRWHDLLFMHWPVPAHLLRPLIPASLSLDTFAGEAWIGVVPFRMSHVRHRLSPAFPWLSAFPELNVRTYVTHRDRPGVWFFSLDAANPVAVRAARGLFHLPYFDAKMSCIKEDDTIRYASLRTHRGAPPCAFQARYKPTGPPRESTAGTLEYFLTNRLSLYSADRRARIYRGDIHHVPWPLRPAEADVQINTMTQPVGVPLPPIPPLLHFARTLDVVAWRIKREQIS